MTHINVHEINVLYIATGHRDTDQSAGCSRKKIEDLTAYLFTQGK